VKQAMLLWNKYQQKDEKREGRKKNARQKGKDI
jgi:hypothetical protein